MRKTIYPVFVLILLAFVFVGCKSEIGETRTVSLVSINAGGALEIDGISSRDTLELTDFSLNDGIYLEVVNPSRTLVSRGDGDSEYLYKMQSGSFIPVPDSTGTSVFSASNLGIDKKANVIVHKMPTLDNDFIISSTEDAYVGKRGLVEEYYYVDLNDPRWSDLDRSEIVVSLDREGGGAFQVIQHGIISRSNNGVLDFSDPSIDGFGVYVYSVFDGLSQTEYCKVQIKNPLHPDSSPVTLVDSIPVLLVDKQEHGEYKLEIAFSGDDAQAVSKEVMNLGFFDTSHTDGSIMPKCVIKELDYDNCKMILHLGSVEEPFVLTLGMRSALSGFSGASATIRLLKDEPGIVFHDISNLEDPIIVQSSSNGCAIWVFKSEIEQEIEIPLFLQKPTQTSFLCSILHLVCSYKVHFRVICVIIQAEERTMGQAIFSVRMDETLKKQFDSLCQEFGMNASTAINIFARAVVRERRIPFEISSPDPEITREGAMNALLRLREQAKNNGLSDMSLDDINEEIKAARAERKK